MRILTAESMAAVDRRAIEDLGIPSLVLMENAARGVVGAIAAECPDAESYLVFCGPGNNGGDGLAVARLLSIAGHEVEVVLVRGDKDLSSDAEHQARLCREMGLPLEEITSEAGLEPAPPHWHAHDLCVDALFGTGLSRPLEDLFADAVERMNALALPVVSIDLPSGLDASSPHPVGPRVWADLTVALGALKVAHVFAPAATAVGECGVADLGIPPFLLREAEGDLHLSTRAELGPLLSPRLVGSHKGDYGHVLVVAGSPGTAGAAILAASGAVRAGAGLVTVGVPTEIAATVDGGCVEAMTLPLPCDELGRLSGAAVDAVLGACEDRTVLALGPGLGTEEETVEAIREIVATCPLPLVLDADGINAFAARPQLLSEREEGATCLTPHPGELARLMDWPKERIVEDRVGAARGAAEETGCVVVLKGHQTVISTPNGRVAVNPTGNPGMATGGSGDVLTGAAAALLAVIPDAAEAMELAVFAHGLAGDLAAEARGEQGLAAGDVLGWLPEAFAELLVS